MTKDERKALRELLAKATPGPWVVEHGYIRQANGVDIPKTDADVTFAAEARTALPALLDALEAAERERDEATPCDCGSINNLDEDGCCNTCGCDLNVPLSWWQAGFREAESRAATAESLLAELCSWAESPAVRAIEDSARIHGVKYRAEDVAIWDRVRALIPTKETP